MHKRNAKEIDTPVATFLANTPFSLIIGLWVVWGKKKKQPHKPNSDRSKEFHYKVTEQVSWLCEPIRKLETLKVDNESKVILPWCLGNQLWQCYPNTSGHICRPAFEVELTSLLTTTRGDLQVKEQRATRVSIEASALRLDENFLFHRKL